uniref:DNA-directed RNA polymerase subunit beta' n=1 Tax=Pleurastrosarcina brevispinosa TaxID=163096 RepID=A0A097KN64_9CHLO|nr:beta' subunit of RNA polymerase [Chlorosarcina brevispinosa]
MTKNFHIKTGFALQTRSKNNEIEQRLKLESIRLGLVSPETIKKWAERVLPNGEVIGQVKNANTVNYKTLKPEEGGLFCERIFGPVNDYECACGRKNKRSELKFCPECFVEFTSSKERRNRLGYIELISPVTHVWYLKGKTSYIPLLLCLKKKTAEAITYCSEGFYSPKELTEKELESSKAISFLFPYFLLTKEFIKKGKKKRTFRKIEDFEKFFLYSNFIAVPLFIEEEQHSIFFENITPFFKKLKFFQNENKSTIITKLFQNSYIKPPFLDLEKTFRFSERSNQIKIFANIFFIYNPYFLNVSERKFVIFSNFITKLLTSPYNLNGKLTFSHNTDKTIYDDSKDFFKNKYSQNFISGFLEKEVLQNENKPEEISFKKPNSFLFQNRIVILASKNSNFFFSGSRIKRKEKFTLPVLKDKGLHTKIGFKSKLINQTKYVCKASNLSNRIDLKKTSAVYKNYFFQSLRLPFHRKLNVRGGYANNCSKFPASNLWIKKGDRFKSSFFSKRILETSRPPAHFFNQKIVFHDFSFGLSEVNISLPAITSPSNSNLVRIAAPGYRFADKALLGNQSEKNSPFFSQTNDFIPENTQKRKQISFKHRSYFCLNMNISGNFFSTPLKDFLRELENSSLSKNSAFLTYSQYVSYFFKIQRIPFLLKKRDFFQGNVFFLFSEKKTIMQINVDFLNRQMNSHHSEMEQNRKIEQNEVLQAADLLTEENLKPKIVPSDISEKSDSFNDLPLFENRILHIFDLLKERFLIGAEVVHQQLSQFDFRFEQKSSQIKISELDSEIKDLEGRVYLFPWQVRRLKKLLSIRAGELRRLRLIKHFRYTKADPEWMVLSRIPVLPPDLRPIIQLDGGEIGVSDLNKLYQNVLFRNNRLQKLLEQPSSDKKSPQVRYGQRLLQEAVDALIENGKGGATPICASNERPLKSLSELLKGKKGRFRQNLLGKRVDYSGRSVIVVGPKLKLHECGLPKEMAVVLFEPFLIQRLMTNKIVGKIFLAKKFIQRQDPIIWEILERVMQNHPILLNRAPTLHRLGIQAFQPRLVSGRAILLHPLVCPAFNADFDGDQMAVHVPLSFQARAEALNLMWSRNNLLSPATGQPSIVPSQDMVLGCYYLTTINSKVQKGSGSYFCDLYDVIKAFYQKKIDIHAPIWVRWNDNFESENELFEPLEMQIDSNGNLLKIYSKHQQHFESNQNKKSQFIRTTPGRILLNKLLLEN